MAPPGFTSKKTSTSGGPPGTSSGTSSRKSRADIGRELDREITRREYFDGRKDVSDDRLDRRLKQAQELAKFKREETKPVYTTSGSVVKGLVQKRTPASMDLAEKQIQLANKYGPTFGEIMSDVTYAGGKVLGALGERAMSGSLGILGALKDVANYALDKANKGYDKLNSVQQEIFENPGKYPYASNISQVKTVNNSRELALEADRDALGLELDALIAQREEDRFRYENPTVDMRAPTKEDLEALDTTNVGYVESGQFKQDLQNSGILSVDDPSTGEPLPDNTKIPGQESTIGDFKQALENQGFNELQIKSAVNEITRQILSGTYTGDFEVDTGSTYPNAPGGRDEEFYIDPLDMSQGMQAGPEYGESYSRFVGGSVIDKSPSLADTQYGMKSLEYDDILEGDSSGGTKVTAYNNPGNLQFAGQQGAIEGQTYGNNFAVFPNAEVGISALRNDLTAKVNRSNKVDDIIGEYAPKADNSESFNNYVSFVKDRVGETVEPNEIDDLTRSVIQFENKPDIANQYLNLLDQPTLVADASKRDIKTLQPIRDMGIGYDMGVDMFSPVIRDLKEKNPTLTDEEIRGIIEGTITQPTGVFAADGGMIDKKLKSLQNGLQNMYNGIPSVKRR